MPRLFVTEITPSAVGGRIDGATEIETLSASLEGRSLDPIQTTKAGTFTLALPANTPQTGQALSIWLERDPTVHVVVPLHLGSGEPHALEDEVKLLRAELELVKTALRRAMGPQGQG